MKRYLLFIISMLCVSIGAWAQEPVTSGTFGDNSSDWELTDGGNILKLTIKNLSDIDAAYNVANTLTSDQKTALNCLKVITTGEIKLSSGYYGASLFTLYNNFGSSTSVIDLSGAQIELAEVTDWNQGGIKVYGLATNNGDWWKNVVVPAAYRGNAASLPIITSAWSATPVSTNKYTITGTTVVAFYEDTSKMTELTNFGSTMRTLKIDNEVGEVDLSNVITSEMVEAGTSAEPSYTFTIDLTNITTASNGSNDITITKGTKVNCLSADVKARVKNKDGSAIVDEDVVVAVTDFTCNVSELDDNLATTPMPRSITISGGTVDATVMGKLNIPGLRYLNLAEATVDNAVLNAMSFPTTLIGLVLPKQGSGPETYLNTTLSTLLTNAKAATSMKYIYVPYSGTQNVSQFVADYVYAVKAGGLWEAMEKEERLRTAVYVKVACDVASGVQLNEDDAKFGNHGIVAPEGDNYPWQFIDLSATFFGVAATNAYTAPHAKGYRIILPDNLTGDHMAIFASKPVTDIDGDNPDRGYRGIPAAVYTYSGTTLKIMEITDASYLPGALHDSRIVRSGTTAIKVVTGMYGGAEFRDFGNNLRLALNGAAESITSANIAVGAGIEDGALSEGTLIIDNDHLTTLTFDNVSKSTATLDVTGCEALTTLNLRNTTFAAVNASDISTLKNVDISYLTATGDINLSNTGLTTLDADHTNLGSTGTLNISSTHIVNVDLTTLTAKSVNASNNDDMKELHLEGILLSGYNENDDINHGTFDIGTKTGTVEVTRSSYTGLGISHANNFNGARIIPSFDELGAAYSICSTNNERWNIAFNKWKLANKGTLIIAATQTTLYNQYLEEQYNDYLDTEYQEYKNEKYNDYVNGCFNTYQSEEEGAGRTPLSKDDWLSSEPEGLLSQDDWLATNPTDVCTTRDVWLNTNPAGVYDTQEAWLAENPDGFENLENWSNNHIDEIIDLSSATSNFESTFEAWYSQNFTKEGYFNSATAHSDYENYVTAEGEYADDEDDWIEDHYADKSGDNYIYATTSANNAWTEFAGASGTTPEPNCSLITTWDQVEYYEASVEVTASATDGDDSLEDNIKSDEALESFDEGARLNAVQVLHTNGTLTVSDVSTICGMGGLKVLDMSASTFDTGAGVTFQDLIDGNLKKDIAIILPGANNTESDMYAAIYAFQQAGYKCVGYYTDKTNGKLNLYGYNETVGELRLAHSPAIVSTTGSLTFLPKYGSAAGAFSGYTACRTALLTALGELEVFAIDMTWLDISELGRDFTRLNNGTHYLIIPQRASSATTSDDGFNYHNDFTEIGTDGTPANHKYYHFNSDVYAVSTYKDKTDANHYSTTAYFGGEALAFDNGYGHKNKTAVLTYLLSGKEEYLGSVLGMMTEEMKDADIFALKGNITSDVIDALATLTNKNIDLTRATATATDWSGYSNSSVECIAMPYDAVATLASLPTVGTCANLYGIGKLVKSDDLISSTSSSKKSTLIYKAQKPGVPVMVDSKYDQRDYKGMGALITMLNALNTNERQYVVTSLIVGGDVAAIDLSADSKGIDENGHLAVTINGGSISGSTQTGYVGGVSGTISGALNGYANVKYWDFSAVELPSYNDNKGKSYIFQNPAGSKEPGKYSYQYDLCYTKLGLAMHDLENGVKIPTSPSVWRLVDDALNNCADYLRDLSIPYNYQYIGTAACYLAGLTHVTTTDANGALIDNGKNTFTFSKNLKEIGNAPSTKFTDGYAVEQPYPVFFSEGIHGLTDVYALRTGYEDGGSECQPTKCYRGAFGAGPTYGWNGFDGGNVYCREKYLNNGQLFTVLHYPDRASVSSYTSSPVMPAPLTSSRRTLGSDSYTEMEKLYTDPTKVYTKKDQTGAVDANGESPLWPTHSELGRSWNQAVRGLIWYDWNIDTENQAAGNINGGVLTATPGNPNDVSLVSNSDHYEFTDYVGWHEFVLSLATYVAPDEKVEDNKVIRTYEEDDWYTFCIPFDMTEQEVALLLGVPRSTDEDPGTDIKIVNKLKTVDSKGNPADKVKENIMPTIVTLKQVTRSSSTNTVSLRCSEDMGKEQKFMYYNPTTGSYTSNGYVDLDGDSEEDPDEEKIMIRAGYPYIIRPYTLCDAKTGERNKVPGNNLGKQILTRYAFKMIASAINHSDTREAIGGDKTGVKSNFAKPYEGHKVQAYSDDPGSVGPLYRDAPTKKKPYNYTFVGQYWTQYLPQNCFYMSGHMWYHNTYPREEGYYWYPYTCLILTSNEDESGLFRFATDNSKDGETNYDYTIIPEETGEDKDGHAVFDKQMQIRFKDGFDDSFTSNARVYHFVFDEDIMDFDEDGQATGIEVLDGQYVAPVRGEVYNMAGQHVGNSLNGLPKGMYIVNGKKIVVR